MWQIIRVNGEIIQPGPRSLDRAIQAIKRSLVSFLNVREADASQMTSTVRDPNAFFDTAASISPPSEDFGSIGSS